MALFYSNYETSIIYFSNLIPVFLGLLGCLFCISKLSFFQISLLLIWALSTPIFIIAGAEFRPDPLWGFLLAWTSACFILKNNIFTYKSGLICGFLFSATLLTKPTTFPLTIVIVGLAFLSRLGFLFCIWKSESELPLADFFAQVKKFLLSFFWVLILTVPYIFFYGKNIFSYFVSNALAENKNLWVPDGDMLDIWGFYLWGGGGQDVFSLSFILMLLLGVFSVFIILREGSVFDKFECLSLLGLVVITLIVLTLGPMKSVFVGFPFYTLLLFLLVNSIGKCLKIKKENNKAFNLKIYAFILIAIILGLVFFKWPSISYVHPSLAKFRNECFKLVCNYLHRNNYENKIYFLRNGPVHPENVELFLLKHGRKASFANTALNPPKTLEEFKNQITGFNLIVIANDDIVGHQSVVKVGPVYNEILSYLRLSGKYDEAFNMLDYKDRGMSGFVPSNKNILK